MRNLEKNKQKIMQNLKNLETILLHNKIKMKKNKLSLKNNKSKEDHLIIRKLIQIFF